MKTKIFFFVAILVTVVTNAMFSQDLIVKRDYSELKVKVLEIQENSIKYKSFDFLEGPLRSISISDVGLF